MTEDHWIRVAPCDHIPPRQGRSVSIGDRELAIFNLGDRFLALDNRCPHMGFPLDRGSVCARLVRK